MTAPRAFRLTKNGAEAGHLGEGPGPFILASESATGYPLLSHARFTASDARFEDEVGEVLEAETDFEAILRALASRAFRLEPVPYELVFQPASEAPQCGPSVRLDLERLLSEDA